MNKATSHRTVTAQSVIKNATNRGTDFELCFVVTCGRPRLYSGFWGESKFIFFTP